MAQYLLEQVGQKVEQLDRRGALGLERLTGGEEPEGQRLDCFLGCLTSLECRCSCFWNSADLFGLKFSLLPNLPCASQTVVMGPGIADGGVGRAPGFSLNSWKFWGSLCY